VQTPLQELVMMVASVGRDTIKGTGLPPRGI
jgi:hypothetical protein